MIDAKELRIGNWVNMGDRQYKCKHVVANLSPLVKPIPLTEQWLKEFGFTVPVPSYPHMKMLKLTECLLLTTDGKKFELLANVPPHGGVQFPCPQLKYVHQLQNLYHALTSKELKRNHE